MFQHHPGRQAAQLCGGAGGGAQGAGVSLSRLVRATIAELSGAPAPGRCAPLGEAGYGRHQRRGQGADPTGPVRGGDDRRGPRL